MNTKKTFFRFLFAPLLFSFCSSDKLAVIMLDGFRWDYADRFDTQDIPAMTKLMEEGVRAEYVQPIFPSMSFPSWTTIVTGLYAEDHGILGNYMWDEKSDEVFSMSYMHTPSDTTDDGMWWTHHVPLWTTATEAGLRTSLYLWSRCDVPFDGILPEKCTPYGNVKTLSPKLFEENLAAAAEDLRDGFDVTFVYFCGVDDMGHIHGPESQEVRDSILDSDAAIGGFLDDLETYGLKEETNVILLTDHGMTGPYAYGQQFELSDYLSNPLVVEKAIDNNCFMNIKLTDGTDVDAVMQELGRFPGVVCYKKDQIPDHLHYKNSDHIYDIIVISVGSEYNLVAPDADNAQNYIPPNKAGSPGVHGFNDVCQSEGYDCEGDFPDMRGIFVASGPKFQSGNKIVPWIKLVDEYQVFLEVLGLKGRPHNGTMSRVEGMFREPPATTTTTTTASAITNSSNALSLIFIVVLLSLH